MATDQTTGDLTEESIRNIERQLGFLSKDEAIRYAFNLLAWAGTAQSQGSKLAIASPGGSVVSFLEVDKKNPGDVKLVAPGPKS